MNPNDCFAGLFSAQNWECDHGGFELFDIELLKDIGSFSAGTKFDYGTLMIWGGFWVVFRDEDGKELLKVKLEALFSAVDSVL